MDISRRQLGAGILLAGVPPAGYLAMKLANNTIRLDCVDFFNMTDSEWHVKAQIFKNGIDVFEDEIQVGTEGSDRLRVINKPWMDETAVYRFKISTDRAEDVTISTTDLHKPHTNLSGGARMGVRFELKTNNTIRVHPVRPA